MKMINKEGPPFWEQREKSVKYCLLIFSPTHFFVLISMINVVMVKGDFPTHQPLSHMQKDLRLALGMSEILDHPLPITANVNEIYKQAKRSGYSEHDSSAIYLKNKF